MFSDAFPMSVFPLWYLNLPITHQTYSKVVDDIVYEVDCQMIIVKEGDVDIGMSFLSWVAYRWLDVIYLLGANPSQEEQSEALEDGAVQVNNVVHSFRLQSTTFDKKSYLSYLKVRKAYTADAHTLNYFLGLHESC